MTSLTSESDEMTSLWKDPERWVDSDMQKAEYLLMAKHLLMFAAALTSAVIVLGMIVVELV